MKLAKILIGLLVVCSNSFSVDQHVSFSNPGDPNGERSIVIVTASYKNKDWYKQNLDSIFLQNYSNYRLIYIDDCSPDKTGNLVEQYIKEKGQEHRVTLIKNQKRLGAVANQYKAIRSCHDNEIIIICDGDDFLATRNVLKYINNVYADNNIWLTYGQFIEWPTNIRGFCHPMPADIVRRNAFREYQDIPSHLRTFYAGLFKRIKLEDFMYEGEFLEMNADIAAMFPMIEMACDHHKFIPEILYIYNGANSINDHKVSKKMQRDLDLMIRARPRYAKVSSPVKDDIVVPLQ